MDPKLILRDNVAMLMQVNFGKKNFLKTANLCGVGLGSVQRLMGAETAMGLDVVERIAKGFGLELWQLMLPGLDPMDVPANPAKLTPVARDLAANLDRLANMPDLHRRVAAQTDQSIDMLLRMAAVREFPPTAAPASAAGEPADLPAG